MTTMTDLARECAEEFEALVSFETRSSMGARHETQKLADCIRKHFPPSVPVSKLEMVKGFIERVDDYRERSKVLWPTPPEKRETEQARNLLVTRALQLADELRPLIAEAK